MKKTMILCTTLAGTMHHAWGMEETNNNAHVNPLSNLATVAVSMKHEETKKNPDAIRLEKRLDALEKRFEDLARQYQILKNQMEESQSNKRCKKEKEAN